MNGTLHKTCVFFCFGFQCALCESGFCLEVVRRKQRNVGNIMEQTEKEEKEESAKK
jgi:hypothetical protein